MSDHSSEEDPRDYSLMREEGIDTGLDSNEAINSLARQVETVSQNVGALATIMSDFILAMKSQDNEGLSTTDGKSLSVLTPPKVPDAIKFNSLDTDHIVSRLFEVEFYIGQLPPGSPPVKAGQLVTGYAHELIMQEIRSGRFASFWSTMDKDLLNGVHLLIWTYHLEVYIDNACSSPVNPSTSAKAETNPGVNI